MAQAKSKKFCDKLSIPESTDFCSYAVVFQSRCQSTNLTKSFSVLNTTWEMLMMINPSLVVTASPKSACPDSGYSLPYRQWRGSNNPPCVVQRYAAASANQVYVQRTCLTPLPRQNAKTSPSFYRPAMPPATGAMSWRMKALKVT